MSPRRRRERSLVEVAGAARRMILATGLRVGEADPEDMVELLALRAVLEDAVALAVEGQKDIGFSWAQIGRGLGVTRQAAYQMYGRPRQSQVKSPERNIA